MPPPTVNQQRPQQDTPWYLRRPDRPVSGSPPLTPHRVPAADHDAAATDPKRWLPWLIIAAGGVGVVIGAVVLLSNVARLHMGGTALDVVKVQAGVLQTLSDPASGYGANTVSDVSCNGGQNPSARQGTTFTCTATVNGAARQIAVLVSDERGTYEIDGPR